VEREKERHERRKKDHDEMYRFLANYDDDKEDDEYHRDRFKWADNRKKYREREEAQDLEDKRREERELERETRMLENELKKARERLTFEEKHEPSKVSGIKRHSTTTASTKRDRPTAVDAFVEEEDEEAEKKRREMLLPIHRKRNLFPIDYSLSELMATGLRKEEAEARIKEIEMEKVQKIISLIPTEMEDLFQYQLSFSVIDYGKLIPWIEKKILELLLQVDRHFTDFVCSQVKERINAYDLIDEMVRIIFSFNVENGQGKGY
jgi:hypothetical protein